MPICLMYGREDPWVKPLWGVQVKSKVPEAAYYQISPAGHCPHDEVPEVHTSQFLPCKKSVDNDKDIIYLLFLILSLVFYQTPISKNNTLKRCYDM